MWDVEKLGGVTMRDAIGAWYRGDPGAAGTWRVDVHWPGNPTCVGVNAAGRGVGGSGAGASPEVSITEV
jgi:hypothetical protein